ncbi:MAG TPA: ABC transporter permease, partial [Thermoprotei archaeon]|nr:ABC transporter permease [Thermoprotei archaeon]
DLELVLIIPPDFSEKVSSRERVKLYALNIIEEVSMFGGPTAKTTRVERLIEKYIGEKYIEGARAPYETIVNPVAEESINYLKGKDVLITGNPFLLMTSVGFASFFMPLILMIIAVTVIQLSATSMAVENEEKTLETLLTFPVSRMHILLSKLLGSFLVSVVGSILNILGYVAYMYIFSTTFTVTETPSSPEVSFFDLSSVMISTQDLVYIVISMVATILFTATLGLIIGAFSSDVRIAGTLVGPLSMAVFIPGYFVAFASLKMFSPEVKALLYCIPLTQPIIMVKQAMTSRLPPETPVYLIVSIVCSIAALYITARIFSLETLSNIQWKLKRIRKRKHRGEEE